jgi:hypothetical protein
MGLMATKKATQEYTTVEEEEVIVMNSQSIDSNSDGSKNIGSPRLWHSPDDKLNHLLEKRGGAQKGSDDHDPYYISEEQEVW